MYVTPTEMSKGIFLHCLIICKMYDALRIFLLISDETLFFMLNEWLVTDSSAEIEKSSQITW